jgi:aminoglycoside 3-N-acetyltransferase
VREKTENHISAEIGTDFNRLGVGEGDAIMVHASFKALGAVPGGIETLIGALLEALGESGTLLLPALSYMQEPRDIHDTRSTPSNVGAIPEYFRLRSATKRSLHPTHSVCGVGRLTETLLGEHHLDTTPCGPHSPFRKLLDHGGKVVLLGCGLKPNTTMHAIEEYAEPPYLFGPECEYQITDLSGKSFKKSYRTHGFDGWAQRYDRVALLPDTGFLRRGKVLEAETCVLDGAGLRQAALARLAEEPFFFVEPVAKQ